MFSRQQLSGFLRKFVGANSFAKFLSEWIRTYRIFMGQQWYL